MEDTQQLGWCLQISLYSLLGVSGPRKDRAALRLPLFDYLMCGMRPGSMGLVNEGRGMGEKATVGIALTTEKVGHARKLTLKTHLQVQTYHCYTYPWPGRCMLLAGRCGVYF